jgi:hypothetical protein
MAEGRMLKRNISESRRLADLKTDSARLLWTWIIPFLDSEGRFYASPDMIKGKIVPRISTFTLKNIPIYIEDMARIGLITLYQIDGEKLLQYRNFDIFQKIQKEREAAPLPGPEKGKEIEIRSGLNQDKIETTLSEVKLREVKLREEKEKRKFLEFVFLTEEEHQKLIEKFGEKVTQEKIEILNLGIGSKGYKYKSHYHTILKWDKTEKEIKPTQPQAPILKPFKAPDPMSEEERARTKAMISETMEKVKNFGKFE